MSGSATVVSFSTPYDEYGVVQEDAETEAEVGGIAADRLRSIIERVERLEEEKAALSSDIKDIFDEAKGAGFIPRLIKRVIKLRKMKPEERQEEDDVLPLYLRALGME